MYLTVTLHSSATLSTDHTLDLLAYSYRLPELFQMPQAATQLLAGCTFWSDTPSLVVLVCVSVCVCVCVCVLVKMCRVVVGFGKN